MDMTIAHSFTNLWHDALGPILAGTFLGLVTLAVRAVVTRRDAPVTLAL